MILKKYILNDVLWMCNCCDFFVFIWSEFFQVLIVDHYMAWSIVVKSFVIKYNNRSITFQEIQVNVFVTITINSTFPNWDFWGNSKFFNAKTNQVTTSLKVVFVRFCLVDINFIWFRNYLFSIKNKFPKFSYYFLQNSLSCHFVLGKDKKV